MKKILILHLYPHLMISIEIINIEKNLLTYFVLNFLRIEIISRKIE
jgi:hypothetical protein